MHLSIYCEPLFIRDNCNERSKRAYTLSLQPLEHSKYTGKKDYMKYL